MITWSKKYVQVFLICLLCVLFIAFTAVIFCNTAEGWIGQRLGLSEKIETLKFLGISMGGVLLALQAVIANNRAVAMENAAKAQIDTAKAQADVAEAQARATEQHANANENTEKGQRQERLKNAIEHMGHKEVFVRLGGAYELFHLAQDTKSLRQAVLDIFCAHIRLKTGENTYRDMYKSKPSEEIQSLLTLLFVQDDGYHTFRGLQINLQGSWLNGAKLDEARLVNADLTGIRLQEANLNAARLHGADLKNAQLGRAMLIAARLRGADLRDTNLQFAYVNGAQLQGANLYGAQLHQAILIKTQFQGVGSGRFSYSESFETRLRNSINTVSDLSKVTFSGGLWESQLDSLVKGFPSYAVPHLRQELMQHVGMPASYELPENSKAITGNYTEEEAEIWIAEYENFTSEVPLDDK